MPDDTPPLLQCPQSFVIELIDREESYDIDFRKLRGQVNATDPSGGDVAVTFIPERATIRTGDYENVTVVASDKAGNLARCFFQVRVILDWMICLGIYANLVGIPPHFPPPPKVAIKPTRCTDWELESPAHGDIECLAAPATSGGHECEATCRAGFRFTDGEHGGAARRGRGGMLLLRLLLLLLLLLLLQWFLVLLQWSLFLLLLLQ